MQQIAVGSVDLNAVEAGSQGPLCRLREGRDDGVDAGLVECLRNSIVGGKGDHARGDGLPATFRGCDQMLSAYEGRGHGGFAPGVRELDAGTNSLGMDECDDALQAGDVVVLVDAEVVQRNAALGNDGGGFKHDQACATLGPTAEVDHMPVVCKTIDGRVLAHGRDTNAVGKGDRTELKWRKERMAHDELGPVLRVGPPVNGCVGGGRDAKAKTQDTHCGLSNGQQRGNRQRK